MGERVCHNVLLYSVDAALVRGVLEVLAQRGIRGTVVARAAEVREKLEARPWDLVIADAAGAGEEALGLLREVKAQSPELPVVMLGGEADVRTAVQAVRAGCEDYLVKPVSRAAMETVLETLLPARAVPMAAWAEEGGRCLYQIAGHSAALGEVMGMARKVARTSVPVLITGESGTGKELVSYYLHAQSSRARGPYIRVNCAALSESLLESELFGHERGAFTGACVQRKGRFERAHGGTLLLDEISETTPRLQAELLRVLEQQDFERVGGSESVRVNVRVICTSNRDLPAEAAAGRFRRDLYYRISGVHLAVPALRERREDMPVLVWHFVNLYAREVRRRITDLDGDLLRTFGEYAWPGNVRELRNVVRTALAMGEGSTLSLTAAQRRQLQSAAPSRRPATGRSGDLDDLSLQELERKAIFEALRRTQSHQVKAARMLGITDRTLREKLRRYRTREQVEAATAEGEEQWLADRA
jgi:DNA-binding NtrC family response regulator